MGSQRLISPEGEPLSSTPIERRREVEVNEMSISANDGLILVLIPSTACRCQSGIGDRRAIALCASWCCARARRPWSERGDRRLDPAPADAVAREVDLAAGASCAAARSPTDTDRFESDHELDIIDPAFATEIAMRKTSRRGRAMPMLRGNPILET